MSNKCLLSIISNITNNKNELWKTVRRTSFQKPHCNPFQSPSSLSMRVSFCLSMLSIPCFRVLSGHFCFTQSGGGSHSLDFDKFCDTAPLKFDSPHVCRIELWWIASSSYLSYFLPRKSDEQQRGKGKREAEIKIIGFLLSLIHDRSQISSIALSQMQSINWLNLKKVVFSLKNQYWISTSRSPNVRSKFNDC